MIEDDPELAEIITRYLNKFDIEVHNIEEPYMGLSELEVHPYDLLILDLTLPGIDGLELIPKIRKFSDIPIIISSARDDIIDKIMGLERGADDYMPKPYDPRELEARIKTILRRKEKQGKPSEKEKKNSSPFQINKEGLQITYQGVPLTLTPAEFDILEKLITHPGAAISRESFIYESSHIDDDSSPKNIDVMISRIRNKLAKIDPEAAKIKSVRGVGYQLEIQ
ncbi:MAG: DNA-binding response regulator [Campylobacteraceae bacterium 4484_4]|nr:MAG: DNA-binding response regulator [Campylobacteraceae bacterium 4484_4]